MIFLLIVNLQCNDKSIENNILSNKRITKEISGNQADTFFIELEKNRFIFASLFQMGIDLYVKIVDPQNNIIHEIDQLKTGPEFISFTTAQSGKYKILVKPTNPIAGTGSYNIGLEKNIKTNHTKEEQVNQLFAEFDKDHNPGAAVAIVHNGNVIFKNGFGSSDIEKNTKINPSTKLNICSIGKQFTAFAIALLEEKGMLSVTDDVRKYIPELNDFGSKITLLDLLNHSSGLREIADLLELSGKSSNGPFSEEDVMKIIYRQKELNFQPGSEYLYCNTGYILLAEVIERITKKDYTEWITENIFKPLEMNNTQFYYDPDNFVTDFAWSYTLERGNYKKELLKKVWYVGAGNVFSTVEDMCSWLINFDYPKLGDKELILKLGKKGNPMNKDGNDTYVYGRVNSKYKGLDYYWHGGGGYGYTAQIIHFPENKFGAIILSNFVYGGVFNRARQIADIYLVDHFPLSENTNSDINREEYVSIKINNILVKSLNLKNYEGTYYSEELDIYYSIFHRGNNLVASNSIVGECSLTHVNGDIFSGDRWYFSNVKFKKSKKNEICEFTITNDRVRNIKFKKTH